MFRSVKVRIVFCIPRSATEAESIVKKIRDLPRRHAAEKTVTAERLAHLESVPLIDTHVSANLRVESGMPECLHARAVKKHVPAIELLRPADQRKRSVSQLRRPGLCVRDEERRPVVIGRDTHVRGYVTIELAEPSGRSGSAAGDASRKPSTRLPRHACGNEVVRLV